MLVLVAVELGLAEVIEGRVALVIFAPRLGCFLEAGFIAVALRGILFNSLVCFLATTIGLGTSMFTLGTSCRGITLSFLVAPRDGLVVFSGAAADAKADAEADDDRLLLLFKIAAASFVVSDDILSLRMIWRINFLQMADCTCIEFPATFVSPFIHITWWKLFHFHYTYWACSVRKVALIQTYYSVNPMYILTCTR